MKKIIGFIVLTMVSVSYADHSLNTVEDGRTNFTKAIKDAAKAKGTPFCDTANSIQIAVPAAADPTATWRQIAFCYKTEAKLQAAQAQLAKGGITKWKEHGKTEDLTAEYGLPVDSVLDVVYDMEFTGDGHGGQKPIAKKLVSISFQ